MRNWEMRGKVAYRLPDDGGSASLHWQQDDGTSALRLSGPLGAGAVQIHTEGALLRVERDGIERLYPANAAPWLGGERLLPIPLPALRYWLRGLPAPDIPVDGLELTDGRAGSLDQAGWQLEFDDYRIEDGVALPHRIHIEVPEAELSLRLLLRQWTWMR
jgi:outer membrane lipoprotein LolB